MSRRGRRSKRQKRARRPKREPKSPAVTIETEETTGEGGQGAEVVRMDQPRLRSEIRDVERYIQGEAFTPEESRAMLRKMGSIVARDDSGRYAIGAYRVILARAKLAHDIDRANQPANPTTEVNIDARGSSIFGIAASLGIEVDIADDGRAERDPDVIEGSSRRSQSEDGGAAPGGRDIPE